ncbi:unnamed protein product, partial [Mesorhabditis spiculigera]
MLFVYLLFLVLYTGEHGAQNPTVSSDFCAEPGCPYCAEYWKVCPGKHGQPICALKKNLVDPEAPDCSFTGCPSNEVKIQLTFGNITCVPLNRIVNASLSMRWMWEDCTQQKEINCRTWAPLCVSAEALEDYNITKGGCIAIGCGPDKPGTHPCMVEGVVECIPYDDLKSINATWDGNQCIRATPEDKAAAAAANAAPEEKPQAQAKSSPSSRFVWTPDQKDSTLTRYNDRTGVCGFEGCPDDHQPCNIRDRGNKKVCVPYWHIKTIINEDQCHLFNPNELPRLKPAKECAGMDNTLACWAGNDYTCIGFDRITSMSFDEENRTICYFAQCPKEGQIACAGECQTIEDVKNVKSDGECEYRRLHRGQVIMIISCSIIGIVVVIALFALLVRVIVRRRNRGKTANRASSNESRREPKSDSNEKRPWMPSKNPKAFNEKPQV